MLNIVKSNVLDKNHKLNTANEVKSSKHFPSSVREWNNSMYVYNENTLNLIPNTTMLAINIIKSYFSLYNYKIERKLRTKRLLRRFRKLSLNKIYISNGEFKHTNNKIIINLYLFNRQKYNYISTLRKLFLKFIFRKNKHRFKHITINKFDAKKTRFNNNNLKKSKLNSYKVRNDKIKNYKLTVIKPRKNTVSSNKLHIHKHTNAKASVRFLKNELKKIKFNNKLWSIRFTSNKISKPYSMKNLNYDKYKLKNFLCFSDKEISQLIIQVKRLELYKNLYMKLKNTFFAKHQLKHINYNKLNNIKFYKYKSKYELTVFLNKNKIVKHKLINKNKTVIQKRAIEMNKNEINKYRLRNTVNPLVKKKLNVSRFEWFFSQRVKTIRKKGLLLLKQINKEKILLANILRQDILFYKDKKIYFFISALITKFCRKFIRKSLRKLKLYLYYKQLVYINKSKYNYNYLQYLNKFLYPLYNKNIEYNLINLKRFYLHSDILSESLILKLTRNRKRLLRKLKKLKKKIEKKVESNIAFLSKQKQIKNNTNELDSRHLADLTKVETRRKIIKKIKHKYITGFRLEAKGRLTRRYTASKSVRKNKYKGNLLNVDSSYKGLSSVLLKGNLKSNLQYTKSKSKTRIGSFGIKGWISGN